MITRAEKFDMDVRLLRPFKGCDPELALAVKGFRASLTPSHSLTSRRYSIRGLFRRHLDEPFGRILKLISSWPDLRRLLPDLFSDVLVEGTINHPWIPLGKRPVKSFIAPDLSELGSPVRPVGVLPDGRSVLKEATRPNWIAEVDWRIARLAVWNENVRQVIRGIDKKTRAGEVTNSVSRRIVGSLDTMRSILDFVRRRRPLRGLDIDFGAVADEKQRRPSEAFCELCWRVSARTKALKELGWPWPVPARVARISDRFCAEHNPSDPGSRYRADLYYKKAFQRELASMTSMVESELWLRFPAPRGADEQETRKTAYDTVHSGLVRIRSTKSQHSSLKERIFALWKKGLSQAVIARELGVSRQAVSKALKSLRLVVEARGRETHVSPTTGEPRVKDTTLELIFSLHRKGKGVAEIAGEVGHLKHTVRTSLKRRGGA
ncbi:helix-turn-helix domain-containing protein [Dyella sedimenti]|uniref:helix-turn-helix domain-containing protein n=1 Tax=Dyella sedimenti TaxID=2919947 RepID=UPI001FAAD58A|nr:helix-turn-helix domain-containing protein [Dyella sedimenti]